MRIRILIGILALIGLIVGAKYAFFPAAPEPVAKEPVRDQIEKLAQARDVEGLAERIKDTNVQAASLAATALGDLGSAAVAVLEPALKDPRPAVREKAATSYAKVAVKPEQASKLATLVKQDQSGNVRAAAVTGLDRMFAFNEMDAIIDGMEDPDPAVRRRAAAAATKFSGVAVGGYNPDASQQECRNGANQMRQHWQKDKHNALQFLNSYYDSRYRRAADGKE